MPEITALADANVLTSMTLCDLIVETAHHGLFAARWSDDIHEEWIKAVLGMPPPRPRALLERRRRLMDANAPGSLVTGYRPLVPTLSLPDAGDCHVLAAAIKGGCNVLVTFNLRHFPIATLAPYGIEPIHPDLFLLARLADDAPTFLAAIKAVLDRMKNPPMSVDEYIARLRRVGLPLLSAEIEKHKSLL